MWIERSFSRYMVDSVRWKKYLEHLHGMPATYPAKLSTHGQGLFISSDACAGQYVIEYTGTRITSESASPLLSVLDRRDITADTLVTVNVAEGEEKQLIDPVGVGIMRVY